MAYIGNTPISVAFLTDTFSGNGSTTAFTMTVAPANTSSILVAITGVVQDPSTYSVAGTTLTFSAAPPSGSSNISVRYLGIPASGVTTTAYRTVTEFTATAGQTSFSVPSYTVGYIDVYRNGVRLGTSDFTATTGTTVVLASGATVGDLVTTESFYVSSVLNAIPATAGAVNSSYLASGAARANWGAGGVLQVVSAATTTNTSTTSASYVAVTNLTASITPSSTTSKILVLVNMNLYGSNSSTEGAVTIYRAGADLTAGAGFADTYTGSSDFIIQAPMMYLDSPSSTSSVTYAVYIKRTQGAGTLQTSLRGTTSTITLMEIAA